MKAAPRSVSDLPAPRGLPLLGNALQLKPETFHLQLEAWARELGPTYRIRIGRRNAVVIADTDLIHQVLRDRPENFGRMRNIQPIFAEMGLDFLFSVEGERWKRQRRVWMASLNAQQLKHFHEGLARITRRLLHRWRHAADEGKALDTLAEAMRYTVDVTMLFALGHDANTVEQGEDIIQLHLNHFFPAIGRRLLAPFPYWRYLKLPADRKLDQALLTLRSDVQRLIEAARKRLADEPARREKPTCFLEALLVARDGDDEGFSDDDIFANTLGVLIAGEDTTANTIAWMVHYLSLHPELLQGVRDEADALLGARAGNDDDEVPDAERFPPYLRYTDAVLNEVLRLRSTAPYIVAAALRDVSLAGMDLPRGTDLFLLTRASAGVNVEAAPPFAPDVVDPAPVNAGPGRAPSIPFGYGPRMCPGRNLAIAEARSACLMLARHFDPEAAPGPGPVHERATFTVVPVNIRTRLRQRAAA